MLYIDYLLELGDDLEIMIEYVNEAGEVTVGTNFGEVYDKEWVITDQAKREGMKEEINQTRKELMLKMFHENIDKNTISKITGFPVEEIEKIIEQSQS